jgi:trigger factor
LRRIERLPEGYALSSETVENTPQPETAAGEPETGHTHEDHEHEHDHAHEHGPALNPDCTRELVLDVDAAEVAKTYKGVTREYQKFARIPGFRPGKVPETVIKRRFAAEIRKDSIDRLLPERFNKAVAELGVKPVGQPQITELTVEEDQPLHVKAVFEYVPEFSIEGYETVTVPKPSAEVTEEEFAAEMDQLRDSRSTIEPVEEERALTDGDWAEISYTGVIEGAPEGSEPVKGESALVEIGGKDTVEAFTSALRGSKVGQEMKVETTYPADYQGAALAGKTVSYELAVQGIKKRIVPELNDEFAKELGAYESLAELDAKVREHLAQRKLRTVEQETREKLFQALAQKFEFPVPESLVQEQVDQRLERGLRALAAQGMATEQMRHLDFDRLRVAQREGALADAKIGLILERIAEAEQVEVDDDELNREVQFAAIQSGEPEEALRQRLTNEGGMARIREQLRREKTAHKLYEKLPG